MKKRLPLTFHENGESIFENVYGSDENKYGKDKSTDRIRQLPFGL